jgi:hypothetical protein
VPIWWLPSADLAVPNDEMSTTPGQLHPCSTPYRRTTRGPATATAIVAAQGNGL